MRTTLVALRLAGLSLTAMLVSCGHHAPLDGPGLHQGVIEHDDRVLAFELSGTVRAIPHRQGAAVAAGDVVAELDDGLERAAIAVRQADLRAAEAALALLRAGTRTQNLFTAAKLAALLGLTALGLLFGGRPETALRAPGFW
nr:biotin/lipoyl-binding protein [Planctomycetota bacterium]